MTLTYQKPNLINMRRQLKYQLHVLQQIAGESMHGGMSYKLEVRFHLHSEQNACQKMTCMPKDCIPYRMLSFIVQRE